jgi:hypothetical protein
MRLRSLVLATTILGLPSASFSQGNSRVMVIPSAVIAFQSADKTYASRDFDDHLDGIGWGGSVAVIGELKNFVVGGEINSARYSKEVTAFYSTPTRITFQETFVSALFGYSSSKRNVQVLGGPGFTLGRPHLEGFPQDPESRHDLLLTGGVNLLLPSSRRIQFAIGARYFYIFADEHIIGQFGLGKSALRTSVGVSFGSAK